MRFYRLYKIFYILFLISLIFAITSCDGQQGSQASNVGVDPFVPAGGPIVRPLGISKEKVRNCIEGNDTLFKTPSRAIATAHGVEWSLGGTAGVGLTVSSGSIPGGSADLETALELVYGETIGQSAEQGEGWQLPSKANKITTYVLEWSEIWQPGTVEVNSSSQQVATIDVLYRTSIRSEIVNEDVEDCRESDSVVVETGQTETPVEIDQNTSNPPSLPNEDNNNNVVSSESYRERFVTSIGSDVLSEVYFSDGMAPYSDGFLATNHGRLQGMNIPNTPTGCGRAQYASNRIWFGSTRVTKISINGSIIGEYDSPTFRGSHGAIFDWPVSVGDMICVEVSPGMEYHIYIGPDVDIHYDSYCYRGHC